MTQPSIGIQRERGTVLVIALVFLLIMTLSGIASMQSTSLGERMAGNTRDRNLAFQSAEAALRAAEDDVLDNTTATLMDKLTDTPPDPLQDSGWDKEQTYSATPSGVVAPPVYVIELLADLSSALEFTDTGGIYRVSSRAQGGTQDSIVVLQTTVGRGSTE